MIPRCKMNKKAGLVTVRGHVRICLERGRETGRGKRRERERERCGKRNSREKTEEEEKFKGVRLRGKNKRRRWWKEKKCAHTFWQIGDTGIFLILEMTAYTSLQMTPTCQIFVLKNPDKLFEYMDISPNTNAVTSTVHREVRAALERKLR